MLLREHLRERHMDVALYTGVAFDEDEGIVTFPLYNLSGVMVGYQSYRPNAPKTYKNHPKEGRYYTFLSGEKHSKEIGVWGVETLQYRGDVLIITEGIFDACRFHSFGVPAVALLSSSYKYYRNWLTCLSRKVYKAEDDHGSKLGPYERIEIPEHRSDVGECTDTEIFQELCKREIL